MRFYFFFFFFLTILLSSIFPYSPPLLETARYRLKYCLKGPLYLNNQPILAKYYIVCHPLIAKCLPFCNLLCEYVCLFTVYNLKIVCVQLSAHCFISVHLKNVSSSSFCLLQDVCFFCIPLFSTCVILSNQSFANCLLLFSQVLASHLCLCLFFSCHCNLNVKYRRTHGLGPPVLTFKAKWRKTKLTVSVGLQKVDVFPLTRHPRYLVLTLQF